MAAVRRCNGGLRSCPGPRSDSRSVVLIMAGGTAVTSAESQPSGCRSPIPMSSVITAAPQKVRRSMGTWNISTVIAGPRDSVFALYADREGYRKLVGPVGATLVRPGRDSRQGLGAVHKLGVGPLGVSEEIVAFEDGEVFSYRAVSPLPVRHWIGSVTFHDTPGGTRVDYALDVEAAIPLPGLLMKGVVYGLAGALARGARRELRSRSVSRNPAAGLTGAEPKTPAD